MNRNWAIINLIQLEHTFWSLSVLKELPQVSLTSITLAPMDREIITNDISVVILFDSNLSFAFEANFCYFFLKKIFCLLNFPSWKFAYRLARYPKRETVINNYLLFWNNAQLFAMTWFWIVLEYFRHRNYITMKGIFSNIKRNIIFNISEYISDI